ncbi:MAG: AMP-dependent synthetase and ligase [Promethearchaeota archaeon CR_4]|nr:MAG: AMP-dependent synthetase and ligase [Candidatus Lokiarchaeota archaeon CR_4]
MYASGLAQSKTIYVLMRSAKQYREKVCRVIEMPTPAEIENLIKPLYPPWVPRTIEIPNIRLDQFLTDAARKRPDVVATSYFGFDLTYKQLDEIANRIANVLIKLGIKKGDTVASHFTNTPTFVATYYGVLRAGAVNTLISPLFKGMEIKYQLNDSDAKAYINWEGFDQVAEPILGQTGVKIRIKSSMAPWISPNPLEGDLLDPENKVLWLEDLIRTVPATQPAMTINPKEDLACLQYTGGTTGLPRAAMLTHFNLVANVHQLKVWAGDAFEDGKEVMLTALPLYHIYAQTVCMNWGIILGAKQVFVSNPREVEELIEAIEHHKVTIFPGVSALYNLINNYKGIEQHDLKSIKFCLSGAGPLPIEIQSKFEKLTGAKLREGYGLTEASPVTHANRTDISWPGFIGLPLANTQIRIINPVDQRSDLPIGQVGELCIAGPQVMKGYYKRPDETRNSLVDINRDGIKWLFTGDLAELDTRGLTRIRDRAKNMIKVKGHSVFPAEVEDYFFQNPDILDVAIVGVKEEDGGEKVMAFIVLKPDAKGKVKNQDIINWAKTNMAGFKVPKMITFLDEIPKGTAGKTLHRILREGKTELD